MTWPAMTMRFGVVYALAVLLNYPWELAQTPLYEGMSDLRSALWHCLVAAFADGLLVLLIVFIVRAALRRDLLRGPGAAGYAVMAVAGLLVGVAVEWWGLQVAGRWVYSPRMPLLPGLGVGFVPVMQMLLLPPVILKLANAASKSIGLGKRE